MPRTVEKTVYKFEELTDAAKEKAREWWRRLEDFKPLDTELYDDFETVAKILGIDFERKAVPLYGGGTRYKPTIYWSGFNSPGDGACFEGSYSYAKGSVAKIKEYAPQDEKLHAIAQGLADVQRLNFYKLGATVKHRGHYYHEHSNTIDVYNVDDDSRDVSESAQEEIADKLRDFMRWMYAQLKAEYEYRMSDEQVDDSIIANEYEFEEDGSLA